MHVCILYLNQYVRCQKFKKTEIHDIRHYFLNHVVL